MGDWQRVLGAAVAATALGGGGTALAANPRAAAHFDGSGRLCENDAAHASYGDCRGENRFSFDISPGGSRIVHFAGRLGPLYCGNVTITIRAVFIAVRPDGSFAYSFGARSRGPGGAVNGHSTVEISGRFNGGRAAEVTYGLLTHFYGSHGPACGGRVTGTAVARALRHRTERPHKRHRRADGSPMVGEGGRCLCQARPM